MKEAKEARAAKKEMALQEALINAAQKQYPPFDKDDWTTDRPQGTDTEGARCTHVGVTELVCTVSRPCARG